MPILTPSVFPDVPSLLEGEDAASLEALRADPTFARVLRQLEAAGRRETASALPVRLAALRTRQDEAYALLPALLKRMHAGGPVHSEKARWAARLAQQLLLVLHRGLLQAVEDTGEIRGLFASQKPAQELLALALDSAWRLGGASAHAYGLLPRGFWAGCHQLYAHALAQGWQDRAGGAGQPTIGTLYRRLLLLGMTGVNRYEPRQLGVLLELIADEAEHLELRPLRGTAPASGGFLLRPEADGPPVFVDAWPFDTPGLVQLETEEMARALDRRIAQLQAAPVAAPRQVQLIARIRQEWVQPPQRRHRRRQRAGSEQVEMVAAMRHCWSLLDRDRADPPAAGWERRFALPEQPQALPTPETPAIFSVSNVSHSGLLLTGESSGYPLVAGELIAYRHREKPWRLGLVRWMRCRVDSLETQCGIEFIGGGAQAVMVTPVTSRGESAFHHALRLHARRVLVVEGRYFHPYREFLVADAAGLVAVRAKRLLMQSAQYQAIEYQMAGIVEDETVAPA